ncbi:MAG: PSD1 and planctomycete cytochrome C domain-containing protein [Planctomycetes bacterium]|nr:PSD1 and planctomycete cytochrome C domain-containing protein [Planctomycetota bacterium]
MRYQRDIRPILSNNCFKCHGPDLKKADLDLQSFEAVTKKRASGKPAIVPNKPEESELLKRIVSTDAEERMPPKGEHLKPEQIAKIKAWIEQGAKYEEHWAYVAPERPDNPALKNSSWVKNPIDAYVLARLEKEGMSASPEADKAILFRRASLDLTGLPPTREELEFFLKDTSADAYEKAVDRLLQSPHYGEHQARWWLDMARYADTNGYEKDNRRTIWPYRDWVINAFNRDLPFDEFTIEQIAGDLLKDPTPEQKIATGFNRNTMVNTEGGTDDEEFRVAAVIDRVNTTMAVWMGTTITCCQCHNHKYDPFTQREFYRLYAFYNHSADKGRSNDPEIPVPSSEEEDRKAASRFKMTRQALVVIGTNPLTRLALIRPVNESIISLQKLMGGIKPTTTMVMQELPEPRETFIQIRGNHRNPGEKVDAGTPRKLHPLVVQGRRDGNRLDLARWLVSPRNPLVGRVTMNRVWARYFGRGIVETSEDFGIQGELPSHPELLDFLAVEFVERKWSLKAMHKLIVTSATYRQSSSSTKAMLERDLFNRLYARGPRVRLDAESVRDNALAISGLLNRKLHGPSVFPFQPEGVWANPYSGDRWTTSENGNQYRRGLYTFWRRTAPYAAFMAFDAPSREVACERRPRSNTPLQALATLNDKSFVECANALARRMITEEKGSEQTRAAFGFRLCVSRAPSDVETKAIVELFQRTLEQYRKDQDGAKKLAMVLGEPKIELDVAELAAWTVVANVLLNLDETITKE